MKTLVIARATFKEAIRQPAFYVLIFLASFYLFWSIFVSYFTFGEDIKMYKDTGLTTISFVCLLLSLLTASSTVADEIEGKTAITLLSKPINRRQFLLGKYFGIEAAVLLMLIVLGIMFGSGVWYKYAYDLRETSGGEVIAAKRLGQVFQVLPGLALVFFEVSLLTAISVAISTRLPILVNMVLCITVFFLGHLTPVLVKATGGDTANDLVQFMISGPVVVQVLEGENAVQRNRDIMGATNPANAEPGTIRKELAESIEANSVHGSDSDENAAIEIAYFFKPEEIVG